MADTYTHKDLAQLCGVSETTIKSYRRKFPGFIPVLTRGKPIRFSRTAGEVCLRIRDCFAKGMSVNETYKVLKESFKEEPSARPRRAPGPVAAPAAAGEGISGEYMEKFFATAGQMMQGMAGLATAQAKAEQRLRKMEDAVNRLIEIAARNEAAFARFLEQGAVPDPEPAPEPVVEAAEPTPEPAPEAPSQPIHGSVFNQPAAEPEHRVRARKIVNIHGPEGEVKTYSLEQDEVRHDAMEHPSDAFLSTPIVIRNDQGDFLGVPGRLPLSGFVAILTREAEEAGAAMLEWRREEDAWVLTTETPGGDTHTLYFTSTTTPRGNLVVLFERLDVNSRQASPQFLQEFFRQVKDKA